MGLARKVDKDCPHCGSSDVYMQEKMEGTGVKKLFDCDSCGRQWSRMVSGDDVPGL